MLEGKIKAGDSVKATAVDGHVVYAVNGASQDAGTQSADSQNTDGQTGDKPDDTPGQNEDSGQES